MAWQFKIELFKSALSLIVAALSLLATWLLGQRLTAYWNVRQKRRDALSSRLFMHFMPYTGTSKS